MKIKTNIRSLFLKDLPKFATFYSFYLFSDLSSDSPLCVDDFVDVVIKQEPMDTVSDGINLGIVISTMHKTNFFFFNSQIAAACKIDGMHKQRQFVYLSTNFFCFVHCTYED